MEIQKTEHFVDSLLTGKSAKHCINMMKQLKYLRDQELFFDVTIAVKDKLVSAHRLVLAAASPYFEALFNPRMKSGLLDVHKLDDFSFEALLILINFAYDGELKVPIDKLEEVIELANYLGMEDALKISCRLALHNLSTTNALATWFVGDDIQNLELKSHALSFIIDWFADVDQQSYSEEICYFSSALLLDVFASSKLYLHRQGTLLDADKLEMAVFKAVLKWIDHDPTNRYEHLPTLINGCIKWEQLTEKSCKEIHLSLKKRFIWMPRNIATEINTILSSHSYLAVKEPLELQRFLDVKFTTSQSHGQYPYNRNTSTVVFDSDDIHCPTRIVGMTLQSRLWEGRLILAGLTVNYSDGKVCRHGLVHEHNELSGSFDLEPNERIVEVRGSAEYLIDSLTFVTNTNKMYGPFCGRNGIGRFVDRPPPRGRCQYLACIRGCEVVLQGKPAIIDLEFIWGYVPERQATQRAMLQGHF